MVEPRPKLSQSELLQHREPVKISEDIGPLFAKRADSNIIRSGESSPLGEYRPVLHLTKTERKDSNQLSDESIIEAKRKARIKEQLDRIDEVQEEVVNEKIHSYRESFNNHTADDMITLAEIEVEDLNEETKKALELKERIKQEEMMKNRKQYDAIKKLEADSKDELYHRSELFKKQVYRLEQDSIAYTREKTREMKNAFKGVGKKLKGYVRDEKEEVERIYKELAITDRDKEGRLGGLKESERKRPQIVKIHLQLARCIKDKLPKGRYAILCSVLDRIGGSPLEFGSEDSTSWRKVTTPRIHSGEHTLNNLRFEKTVHLVTPSLNDTAPSMVYLFELFLLRSREFTHDQVLGWGVFPLINSDFELNLGRFKV